MANVAFHLPLEAAATQERRLEAVRCSAEFSAVAWLRELLCPTSPDEHLGAHYELPMRLECRQTCLHLLPDGPATRCRQRAIRLRYLPGACFDRSPVGVERCDGPLARLSLHLNITKTCHAEQVCKPLRICQRKTQVERGALLGEMATERVGEYAPHRCPIRGGEDADGGTPARTENASELRETPRGSREEL